MDSHGARVEKDNHLRDARLLVCVRDPVPLRLVAASCKTQQGSEVDTVSRLSQGDPTDNLAQKPSSINIDVS